MEIQDLVIVGAGAAGCFAAAVVGQINPNLRIVLLEKTRQPLAKVRISGGGRCNVTHNCFDVSKLVANYPRGSDFLKGAFHRFQPQDMINWLESQGVVLKVEADGRMFPVSNSSATIIDCFLGLIKKQGVNLLLESEVIQLVSKSSYWELVLKNGQTLFSKKVLFTTGGVVKSYSIIEDLGHVMEKPLPSLFTFELQEEWIKKLTGSVIASAEISIEGSRFTSTGPLLITHWGFSGPAILKLSAFAAKWLFDLNYQAVIHLNWTGEKKLIAVKETLLREKKGSPGKKILLCPLFSLSKNLWRAVLLEINPSLEDRVWARISPKELDTLAEALYRMPFKMIGKSTNKDEFVTCGGVSLDEIYPKTMESKKAGGIYFAGEVLNIDGVTGGFNFQNAWTSAWIAANAIAQALSS